MLQRRDSPPLPHGFEADQVRLFADRIYATTGPKDTEGVLKRGNLDFLVRVFLGDALFHEDSIAVERFICEGVMFVQAALDLRLDRAASSALILQAERLVTSLGVNVPSAASQGVI